MSTLPRLQPLEYRTREVVGYDAVNEPIYEWSDWAVHLVYGWGPPEKDDVLYAAGRDAIVRDVDIYDAPDCPITADSEVRLNGLPYVVVGHPGDFNHGPFGFEPGVRVSVKRVEERGDRG